jgi:hypothetical protein
LQHSTAIEKYMVESSGLCACMPAVTVAAMAAITSLRLNRHVATCSPRRGEIISVRSVIWCMGVISAAFALRSAALSHHAGKKFMTADRGHARR